jgi:hypothetical protein
MGVHWNEKEHYLYHNPSVEWDVLQWYKQIISAVKNEYEIALVITSDTVYENLDKHIKIILQNGL